MPCKRAMAYIQDKFRFIKKADPSCFSHDYKALPGSAGAVMCRSGGIGQIEHGMLLSFFLIQTESRDAVKKKPKPGGISYTDCGKGVEQNKNVWYNLALARMILESPFLSDEV